MTDEKSLFPAAMGPNLGMQRYVGTKYLRAKPMSLGDYSAYRGWKIPPDQNATDRGYLVEYEAGGAPNHPDHQGYISWSPATVFEQVYSPVAGD